MLKLMRFMKPFLALVLVAMALLYGQAMADLALPDYLSRIVNVGIQQGGSESPVPEALRQEDFEQLLGAMAPEEAAYAASFYEEAVPGTAGHEALLGKFPAIREETVLVLEDPAATGDEALRRLMAASLAASMGMAVDESMLEQAGARGVLQLYASMGADPDKIRSSYILGIGLVMIGIALLGAAASILVGFIAARVAAGVGRNLREAVFAKVSRFTNAEFDRFSTASLITRSTNDVMQIQTLLVIMIRMFIYAPILGFGGILHALERNSSMTWTIALSVGLLVMLIAVIFSIAMPRFKLLQKLVDKVNLVMRENLTGMMVVRAFNTQAFEEGRFDAANKELTDTSLFVNRIMAFLMPVMMLIMNGASLLVIWVGAKEVAGATMQVGDMMAFMQYAMQIIMAFLMLSMMFVMVPRASVAAGRIAEVLDTDIAIKDPARPRKHPEDGSGQVAFNDVRFRYDGAEEDMLKGISFTAKPGETTAIIGSTGSGKSTLVNLIPRFYDAAAGSVLVDGLDVREVSQEALRERIGYVPQKASLFSGTIAENMRFAKEQVSFAEMEQALAIAQAEEVVAGKEGGLNAAVSQNGANFSGGQRQRLSIARALVKKPKILIFDDSFSALDYSTDRKLRKALKAAAGSSTLIVVAQRIATIMEAEQIIVLDDGRIAGKGTHRELLEGCSVYREIAYSQLSKEELA